MKDLLRNTSFDDCEFNVRPANYRKGWMSLGKSGNRRGSAPSLMFLKTVGFASKL